MKIRNKAVLHRLMRLRVSAFVIGTALLAGASGVATPLAAQEKDSFIFHYTAVDGDVASSDDLVVSRWDAHGWIGGDFDRLWWSTEGEGLERELESVEAMVLYGHYFRRFWDVVVGYRQDLRPARQGYLTAGVMGLAPYWFEVGLFAFLSHDGDPSIRAEAETDLFITQRAVLSLGGEMDWLLTDDETFGLEAGLGELELGARIRYEIHRKFAPYIDLTWVEEGETMGLPETVPEPGGLRLGGGLRLIY